MQCRLAPILTVKFKTMKLKLFLPLALLAGALASAQNMQTYQAKIDSIVTSEKSNMNREMDVVDGNFAKGRISQADKIALKKEIAEKYEKIINEKVDQQNEHLQALTKEMAVESVFRKENDTTKSRHEIIALSSDNALISYRNKKSSNPKTYLKSDDLAIGYGFLNLTEKAGSFNPFEESSRMRIGNSHSFEIQARRERQLGSYTSPFFIRYGLAYRNDTYMPKRPLVTAQNTDNIFLEDFAGGRVKRSKLRNVYLTFPVEFQWVLNPKYAQYEGKNYLDNQKRQFRIGLGAYAGIRLRSIAKVKYYNENDKFDKYDFTLDSGVNSFLFGAKFSVGYGGINLFIKKDLTPIFNDHALLPNKNGIQIGIDIMDLNF